MVCLKRYLGHIIKCRSVEELEQVRDGVTPDCYSYSNFIFRHLKKKDYTTRACIGRRVSKARLAEYEKDVEELSRQEMQLDDLLRRLKEARDFECLKDEPSSLFVYSWQARPLNSLKNETGSIFQTFKNPSLSQ